MKQNWQYKKLGDCFSSIGNGANIKQFTPADGFPITRIETLSNNNFNRDKLGYANIFDISKYSNYILENGDILMSHINSIKYLGRAVLYKKNNNETIIHGMNLLRLVPISNIVTSTFVQFLFKSFYFRSQILRIAKKAVNQASFTTSDLKKLIIPIPPLSEQERIVVELDLLSGIIEKQKQQLKELDTLAQSIFYSMFGDPITNEKNWEFKFFKDFFQLKSGDGLSEKNFIKGDFPVYGGNGISGFHNSYNKSGNHIIIGRVGVYCGNVRFVKGNFWLTDNAFDTYFDNNIFNYLFLCFLLNSVKLNQYANHAAQPVISNIGLKNILIIAPPLSLQNQFAEKIEKIEKQKEAINKSIEETQKLFDYTMDKYFG